MDAFNRCPDIAIYLMDGGFVVKNLIVDVDLESEFPLQFGVNEHVTTDKGTLLALVLKIVNESLQRKREMDDCEDAEGSSEDTGDLGGSMNGSRGQKADDATKASALVMMELSPGHMHSVAKDIGIPKQTLSRWANGRNIGPQVTDIMEDAKEALAKKLEDTADLLINKLHERLTKGDVEKLSVKDIAIAYGIISDKARLARGESTTKDSTEDAKADLKAQLKNLKNNLTVEKGGTSNDDDADGSGVPVAA